jgi:LmbE family N-acetylglucosaminyl deacetylase
MITVRSLDRPGERGEDVLLPYLWVRGCPCSVPPAPDWLSGWIATAPPATAGNGSAGPAVDPGQLQENGLPVGLRNTGLHWYMCSLYARLWADPEVEQRVTEQVEKVLENTPLRGFTSQERAASRASARAFVERSQKRTWAKWEDRWKLLDR